MSKKIVIRFIQIDCWKCKEPYYIYYVMPDKGSNDFNNNNLIFNNKIISKVKELIDKNNLIFGEIKKRYSRTRDEEYMSFGCPKCDAICGDWFLNEIIFDTVYEKQGDINDIEIEI